LAKFFISYRRQDAQYQADKLHSVLSTYVANPREDIFIDVDNIPFGRDFVAHLDSKVSNCEVLLAVIGPLWLDLRDPVTGQRLLDHPADFVRIEIESALKRDIPVVPILLDGVSVPRASDLPESLQPLVRRNGIPVQRLTFEADVARLMQGLGYDSLNSTASGPLPHAQPKPDAAADLRQTWAAFPVRENVDAVARFLARVSAAAPGSGLEFEIEHHLDGLRRHEDAARRVEQKRRDRQRNAAEAALLGKPVAERTFFLDLPDVPNWPAPEMVAIPPGRFLMGAAKGEKGAAVNESPQHEVRIEHAFALGRYTVTFAEWDAARADGAKLETPDDRGWGRANRPVICVNSNDVTAYLMWLNDKLGLVGRPDACRLPSESEWEYAARAGSETPFGFGATISTSQANYDGNYTYGTSSKGAYFRKTVPLGSYPANNFGLNDMHGNVWEWTRDCWNETYSGAPSDGTAWTTGDCARRSVRGGSWNDDPRNLRSAARSWSGKSDRLNYIGFRVARTL
jgi:formylglycine-generating enzyme required for sulfatase activity